jgi:hypothetical protein
MRSADAAKLVVTEERAGVADSTAWAKAVRLMA